MTEEKKIKALCLRYVDYGESDRLITLLTDTCGKITVKARGVLTPKAKLRSAAQPFAFGDYIVAQKNGFNTLTAFDWIDGFTSVSDNIIRYYQAAAALETADKLTEEGEDTAKQLSMTVRYLMHACYEQGNCYDFLHYVLAMLAEAGYGISPSAASVRQCGVYVFDLEEGGFASGAGRSGALTVKVSAAAGRLLDAVAESRDDFACDTPFSVYAEVVGLLSQFIKAKTGKTLKSYFELAELMALQLSQS